MWCCESGLISRHIIVKGEGSKSERVFAVIVGRTNERLAKDVCEKAKERESTSECEAGQVRGIQGMAATMMSWPGQRAKGWVEWT